MNICSSDDIVLLAAVAGSAERAVENNLIVLDNKSRITVEETPQTLRPPPPPTTVLSTATRSLKLIGSEKRSSYSPNIFGRLCYKDEVLYITEFNDFAIIGRNSSTSTVHFPIGKNSFVSRKHLKVSFEKISNNFHLICLSKNGVFVNDAFQRKSSEPLKLPRTCTFRFPSTSIRISFESYVDHPFEMPVKTNKTIENSNVIYAPLKISIPEHDKRSPFPSPTGTISAANSCPTSPRQNYQVRGESITFERVLSNEHDHLLGTSSGHYKPHNHQQFVENNHEFEPDIFPPPSSFNEFEKPPYSYAQLIVQSISASPEKQLTLSGIYSFISKHYPYYRKEANKGWQNSIRHNLSLNRFDERNCVARSQDEPGKGSFWRIEPNSESKLIDQSYKKRRQRGSQCFRTPYGMPRSAPVSPSHMDNLDSVENSPLHDIVLQSAPGSPGSYPMLHAANGNNDSDNYQIIQNPSFSKKKHFRLSYIDACSPNVIVSTVPTSQGQIYEDQYNHAQLQHHSILHHKQITKRLEGTFEDKEDKYNHNVKRPEK